MDYRITGLPADQFIELQRATDDELQRRRDTYTTRGRAATPVASIACEAHSARPSEMGALHGLVCPRI